MGHEMNRKDLQEALERVDQEEEENLKRPGACHVVVKKSWMERFMMWLEGGNEREDPPMLEFSFDFDAHEWWPLTKSHLKVLQDVDYPTDGNTPMRRHVTVGEWLFLCQRFCLTVLCRRVEISSVT